MAWRFGMVLGGGVWRASKVARGGVEWCGVAAVVRSGGGVVIFEWWCGGMRMVV